jgi:exodeoxyribonuclease III
MKIISYNINGIRAACKKGFVEWLATSGADVVCLQEVKATYEQCDYTLFEEMGYKLYWHAAVKKGYSGVATFSKIEPKGVFYGCGMEKYDQEGRVLRIDFENFSILNVYMPSGSSGEDRQQFKFEWLDDFKSYVSELMLTHPNLVICGDYNICHQAIDIHNPKSNANSSGFLPEERAWFTSFLDIGFIDTFRHLNPEPHHYSWWSYRAGARGKNLGWRIDYHLISKPMEKRLAAASILPDVPFSDHCPVVVELVQ